MQTITVQDLKKRLDAGEEINLVDVREQHERDDFNIGGIHVPLKQIQVMQVDELEDLKDQELVVYCRSGNRSGQAAMILQTMGFTNVKNLTGGMLNWIEVHGH